MNTKNKFYPSENAAINALLANEKKEVGYLEKKSNASLNSKTANAGYNNFTKYWKELNDAGVLGMGKGFAGGPRWYWCAGYQCNMFIKTFGIENARKLLLHLPYTSCNDLADLANSKDATKLHVTPKKGDIVLFFNGSRYHHTGLVTIVGSSTYRTNEGNTNKGRSVVPNGGEVCEKEYTLASIKRNHTRFFRPDYSLVVKTTAKVTEHASNASDKKVAKTTPKVKATTKKYVTVATKINPLTCRLTPSKTGKTLGKFKKGSKLTLVSKKNTSFWKVTGIDMTSKKTITGYVNSSYLK